MKQKKKACGSDGMGLVLMRVKKGTFDKRVKDSKEKRKEERQNEQSERTWCKNFLFPAVDLHPKKWYWYLFVDKFIKILIS
ncbi:hypothetical protein AGMMS49556_03380 [Endomicrobiia bacterium]|nr:hypothetical protein AGMMS49556_03380 [Endomicrobiia bacterium]